jgi:hypothetical protein
MDIKVIEREKKKTLDLWSLSVYLHTPISNDVAKPSRACVVDINKYVYKLAICTGGVCVCVLYKQDVG